MSVNNNDFVLLMIFVNEGKLKMVVDFIFLVLVVEKVWEKLIEGYFIGKILVIMVGE